MNWITLSSIQVGGAVCLPMIFIGYMLLETSTLIESITSVFIGNIFLLLFALASSIFSVQTKMSTAQSAVLYFGKKGPVFLGVLLCISMSAWFALQTAIMTEDLFQNDSNSFYTTCLIPAVLSLFIILFSFVSKNATVNTAKLFLPFMIITLGISLVYAYITSDVSFTVDSISFNPKGIALVLSASIAAVVDLPTFFSTAKNKNEAIKACFATFLFGIPLIQLVGITLAFHTKATSLVATLSNVPLPFWKIWVFVFIFVAGWTTNNMNLYSAVVSMQAILPQCTEKKATGLVALLILFFCLSGIQERLLIFLEYIGIFTSSLGVVILLCFFFNRKQTEKSPLFHWLLGVFTGIANRYDIFKITEIALVDAVLVTALVSTIYFLVTKGKEQCIPIKH